MNDVATIDFLLFRSTYLHVERLLLFTTMKPKNNNKDNAKTCFFLVGVSYSAMIHEFIEKKLVIQLRYICSKILLSFY